MLGLAYFRGGHPADAIPLLEKVQGWYSRANVDAAYVLGIAYIQTKNYDQARKSFGKMFDVAGDSAAAYLFTARMLLRQEYDPVAEEYAQKAAALDPRLPLAHFLLGELYLYKSRITEAIAEFQKEAAQLQLPIGWSAQAGDARSLPNDLTGWLRKLLGIALTVVAISLGAPFWFELLNKLLNLRLTGKPQ